MKLRFSFAQIGGALLIFLNVLIVGPGGWVLNKIWENTEQFRSDTNDEIDNLNKEFVNLKIKMSEKYVNEQEFRDYREQMTESIRYIDSKLP